VSIVPQPKRDLAIVFLDTAYSPASPSCDHGGRRNLESKGFERPGELIIAGSKKDLRENKE
jgi:hypothetical protein